MIFVSSLKTSKYTQMWIKLLLGGVKHVPSSDRKTSLDITNITPKTLLNVFPVTLDDSNLIVRFTDDDEDFGDLFGFHDREGFVGKITGELFEDAEKLPFEQENPEYFPSLEVAEESRKDVYGTLFDHLHVKWDEFESDEAFTLLAFNGIGMYYLAGIPNDSKFKDKLPSAAVQIDMDFMHQFACREPYERYGCIAYFDINKAPVAIYWSAGDKLVYPGDADWEHAKFVFRCTLCVVITCKDHLINLHWQVSNTLMFASRQSLSEHHALRRLIKPHTFRVAKINWVSRATLFPINGLAHRTFALEAGAFHEFMAVGIRCLKFQTFPDEIQSKNLPPEIASDLPYKVDGEALWSVIRSYVAAYMNIFYPSDEDVLKDSSIRQFYAHYQSPAGWIDYKVPELSKSAVIDLISHAIFWVTGGHEYLGGLMEYVLSPTGLMPRIGIGKNQADLDSFFIVSTLYGTTIRKVPMLMDNWNHILIHEKLTSELKDKVVIVMDKFQSDLIALSKEIEARNDRRAKPFQAFNPAYLECSISV